MRTMARVLDLVLLVLRVTFGGQLLAIGAMKLLDLDGTAKFFESLSLPQPSLGAVAAGLTEALGGLLLLLGMWSRLAATPVLACMLVAYFAAHRAESFVAARPFPFLCVALAVLVLGPGRLSLDHWAKPKIDQLPADPKAASG